MRDRSRDLTALDALLSLRATQQQKKAAKTKKTPKKIALEGPAVHEANKGLSWRDWPVCKTCKRPHGGLDVSSSLLPAQSLCTHAMPAVVPVMTYADASRVAARSHARRNPGTNARGARASAAGTSLSWASRRKTSPPKKNSS